MDKKQELQTRIARGQQNVNRLSKLASKLPPGPKRDELADKAVRMLGALANLEDGFTDFYPGNCLYEEKDCSSHNKGTFHCASCPSYLNAVYEPQDQQPLIDRA